jgi:phenylalanyl-tRNA synthetase beta chain
MRASYNWLRELVPGLAAAPGDLAERMTRSGLEVEEVVEYGAATPACVIAEVRKVEPHPQRERLTLVTVDRGGAEQTIVCGAPNVPPPGGRVVLAPLGTHLPAAGLTLQPRKIAGVESQGMLVSEQELGLTLAGGKGEGILVLDGALKAGTPLAEAMPSAHDFILDIGVTPNRPDALGHLGLAREISALFGLEIALSDPPAVEAADDDVASLAQIAIEDTERCPHYGAGVILGVKVGPSHRWLRRRLESLGIRAISNVVDVTNHLLLGFGHPTHAFDLDRLAGGRVIVRRAREGEKIVTIDHVERRLSADNLLITDGDRPIAIAGVMGGVDTEIGEGASRVLLEVAYFAPRGVRRTARRHGLHSEASHRFERGIDPEGVSRVLAQGLAEIAAVCGGRVVKGRIIEGVAPPPHRKITLRQARMTSLLGLEIPPDRSADILKRLGCSVVVEPDRLEVEVPSHRPDMSREEDVIEEVMRVHGVDHLPTTHRPLLLAAGRSRPSVQDRARWAAAAIGLSEALCFSFVSPADLAAIGAPRASVTLKNPLSEERSVMRTSLLPGLFEALRRARRHGVTDVRLFATGRVFLPGEGALPTERAELAGIIAGTRRSGVAKAEAVDVFDAKGLALEIVERVTRAHGEVTILDNRNEFAYLHPRGAAGLTVGGQRVAHLGPVHPEVVERLDLGGEAFVFVIDLDALAAVGVTTPQYRPIPTLPAATRDLALVADATIPAGALERTIFAAAGPLCESVELFDLYAGKGVPEGQRSLAYRLVFRDPKSATAPDEARTLTDEEVAAATAAVVAAVKQAHGATVRGG